MILLYFCYYIIITTYYLLTLTDSSIGTEKIEDSGEENFN